jgi:eukaryotic-like serine/threonine-protein kinase
MTTPVGIRVNGRYRLDARIGHGGMSTVYRSFDEVLERTVAVKVMDRDIAGDSDQLERFRREARAVAQLNDPHIVTVIDAGEDEQMAYIVFEYVEGENLKDRLRREGPLAIPEAVAYAIEVARALSAAHGRHIVHRDVKPQNILLDSEGSAKITDFGIARTLTEEGLTGDGRVLGTTDYVSPEQALGHKVTGQSDLYSLGVVLYEMLTGEVPFTGDSPVAVAMKHVREELPDVQRRREHVSAALAAVVERATAKDLSVRYPDAASFATDLEEVLAIEASRSGQTSGEATMVLRALPAPTRRRAPITTRRSRGALIALALIVLLAAAGVLYALFRSTHRGTTAPPSVVVPPHLTQDFIGQNSAHDYNPFGTGPENSEMDSYAVDGDPNTLWSTEQYYGGTLKHASGGVGVGIYLDAAPGVVGRALEVQTPTPGFGAEAYVANHIDLNYSYGDTTPLAKRGWIGPVGSSSSVQNHQQIQLDTAGRRYRYYLLWLTSLPPGKQMASIAELTLFKLSR